ncbi:hypothetical protein A3I27_00740 [Candidatus Giovannonibacteria bacterium RIFCSPLOWO2_02_FULL_43_11b]|uniref:Uncharacterized protein n=1 Tax=Candidatus Giovannonibacteria bacterium RIFCSPHIGHO2_12_FULL_43_15 TaxID=1798341 RepID=A0A1F5WPT3_9BACT|nr:MAG: hypothetical protein A3B97_01430 [Candidatus Giovannonibacteria bacterium RIFCSPHIGHO2_02_FULL_43_32]OGF77587.1 MAG: hypothetical protein A3F23_00070 [Candidatus Giovannonibacteria bacterium RIFCSPHIGHO2_12_FULL_43_15]OGF90180.1 MAG: hypothetical protein A3I27_00740 [Candidatus Giovannonibacteria bacterium RIFCSPLOWO2_02_FULL_43_11b]OGF92560.1 MAG: hypothetical protein A3H04_01910 [Candidatus Giovannonibacteria bacterium RIFCSPLOWO2_12_FULL_43_11c]
MKLSEKTISDLDEKFQKVLKTPAGYDFYVAIHDFIEHIESNASLTRHLSIQAKSNQELRIFAKYNNLKQIYQGLEDTNIVTKADLGHARYMVLVELNKIRNNDLSESNSFWKKRELFRKLSGEIYERLNPNPV